MEDTLSSQDQLTSVPTSPTLGESAWNECKGLNLVILSTDLERPDAASVRPANSLKCRCF